MIEPFRYLSSRMACYWCRCAGKKVPAIVRIFSGSYGGEGFAACDEHRIVAETLALQPLARPEMLAVGYRVRAYEVVLNKRGDAYALGRQLWTARPKEPRPVRLEGA